ncbi:MAG: hypothetical protein KDC80_01645 [Saprospiraceae bacterium]|nr:hypothetical protein [Saprospiraceae bacterium]
MRTLIKLALLIIVGVLVYNYFLGTEQEKATSEKVFRQVKEVGRSIGDLIKNEREKFKDGKYDEAFDKLGEAYEKLKGKVDDGDNREEKEMLEKLEKQKEDLQQEKKKLEDELSKENPDEEVVKRSPSFEEELQKLMDETSSLLDRVMRREKKEEKE